MTDDAADRETRVRRVLRAQARGGARPSYAEEDAHTEEEAEEEEERSAGPPINVKRRRGAVGRAGGSVAASDEDEEEEDGAPGIPAGVTDEHVRAVAGELRDRATASRDALGRIAADNQPQQVLLDRMVRAVMRTMLFRAGRKPGAPVKRSDLIAALDAAVATGGGPAAGRQRHPLVPTLALAFAREAFARDFCLDMARVDLVSAGRGGRVGGGGGGASQEAYVLRTLLPPPAAAVVSAAAGAGTRPPSAPGLALLAAALVRLGGSPASAGAAGGGGGAGAGGGGAGRGGGPARSGPAPTLGGPGWMEEGELWSLLADLGARRPVEGPGALEAAWAGLHGRASNNAGPGGEGPPSTVIPGVGEPVDALKAAVDGRWLVERWGPPVDPGAGGGGRVRWYGVGETAAGGDGGAALDAFIRLVFESPDPAAELAAELAAGRRR